MTTGSFYDQLSEFYHLLFPEGFDRAIQQHAEIVDLVIRETWGERPHSILDASCGIGTQAIGLAQRGYCVSASDISPGAIIRAKREAASRNVTISFQVSDMQHLHDVHSHPADVVIAIDSAIQHLLSDEEIRSAFEQFYAFSQEGGGCIISVRDYEHECIETGTIRPYGLKDIDGVRYLMLQVWERRADIFHLSMYAIKDSGDDLCETSVMRTQYYPIPVLHVMELLEDVGFVDIQRRDDLFFQPMIVGRKV